MPWEILPTKSLLRDNFTNQDNSQSLIWLWNPYAFCQLFQWFFVAPTQRFQRVWPPHSTASKLLCLQMLTNPTQTQFLHDRPVVIFFHKHILLISHKNNTCERMTNNGQTKTFVSGLWAFCFLMYLLIKHMISVHAYMHEIRGNKEQADLLRQKPLKKRNQGWPSLHHLWVTLHV